MATRQFKNVLDFLEGKALSNFELLDLLDGASNLMTYEGLAKCESIEEALGPHRALVLLFETKDRFGHWCCVFERPGDDGEPVIEFFDSYGYKPDEQLRWAPMAFRARRDMVLPHLTALLLDAAERGYAIEYSDHKLQEHAEDTNTCGRWVATRLLLRGANCDEFAYAFRFNPWGLKPDWLVTLATLYA